MAIRIQNKSDLELYPAELTSNSRFATANFEDADLEGVSLEGLSFKTANFQGADLRNGNLLRTVLGNSVFKGAHLEGARISGYHQTTRFEGAFLQGATLYGEYMGVNFRGANLRDAVFRNASLINVDFEGAHLQGVLFENTYIHYDTRFNGAKLDDAVFQGVTGTQPAPVVALRIRNIQDLRNIPRVNEIYEFEGANLQGAELPYANLQGANLKNADLRGVNLQGANLQGANLQGANLQGANLRDANLMGAKLYGCNLSHTIFEDANISYTMLCWTNAEYMNAKNANLMNASLDKAYLDKATFEKANLTYATLIKSILKEANLSHACCIRANFSFVNLTKVQLKGTTFIGATHLDLPREKLKDVYGIANNNTIVVKTLHDLKNVPQIDGAYQLAGADLRGAELYQAALYRANLEGANLEGAYLDGANLEYANLQNAYLKGTVLGAVNAGGAIFQNAYMSGIDFEDTTMQGAEFQNANLRYVEVSHADFTYSIFKNADIRRSTLSLIIFDETNFQNAILQGSSFEGSSFINADFQNADTRGANFQETILTDAIGAERILTMPPTPNMKVELHNAFSKINIQDITSFFASTIERGNEMAIQFANMISTDFRMYINDQIHILLTTLSPEELTSIPKVEYPPNIHTWADIWDYIYIDRLINHPFTTSEQTIIGFSLTYVRNQPLLFQNNYILSYLNDIAFAYTINPYKIQMFDGYISCTNGILERFITCLKYAIDSAFTVPDVYEDKKDEYARLKNIIRGSAIDTPLALELITSWKNKNKGVITLQIGDYLDFKDNKEELIETQKKRLIHYLCCELRVTEKELMEDESVKSAIDYMFSDDNVLDNMLGGKGRKNVRKQRVAAKKKPITKRLRHRRQNRKTRRRM